MGVSTAPAVLDALVSGFRLALPDVQVVDGQPLELQADFIAVGWAPDDEPGVDLTRAREQLGADADRETYAVACIASAWSGSTDPKRVRDRCFELINAAAGALSADPNLGGECMTARLSVGSLTQEQTSEGAQATVRFSVQVDAFTG